MKTPKSGQKFGFDDHIPQSNGSTLTRRYLFASRAEAERAATVYRIPSGTEITTEAILAARCTADETYDSGTRRNASYGTAFDRRRKYE